MSLTRLRLVDGIAVTAIVAVIGALVQPVIGQSTTDADAAASDTCSMNLKQLDLGIIQYVQDYDEDYPSGANYNGTGSGWAQQIFPYVRTTAIMKCPLDSQPHDVVSYGMNSNLVRLTGYRPSAPIGMSLRVMSAPTSTIAFFEVSGNTDAKGLGYQFDGVRNSDIHASTAKGVPIDGWSPGGHGTGDGPKELSGMGDDAKPNTTPLQYATGHMRGSSTRDTYFAPGDGRHQSGSIFAFTDGHVKWLAPSAVSAGINNGLANDSGGAGKAANTSYMGRDGLTATFSVF